MSLILGADLGGTRIKAGARGLGGRQLVHSKINGLLSGQPIDVIIEHVAKTVLEVNDGEPTGNIPIGLAMPGDFNYDTQTLNCRRFGLQDFRYLEEFRRQGLEVIAINDAQAAGLGELKFGAGRRYKNFIMLNLGTGMGAAIVLDGKLLRTNSGRSIGLVAHMVIDPK